MPTHHVAIGLVTVICFECFRAMEPRCFYFFLITDFPINSGFKNSLPLVKKTHYERENLETNSLLSSLAHIKHQKLGAVNEICTKKNEICTSVKKILRFVQLLSARMSFPSSQVLLFQVLTNF